MPVTRLAHPANEPYGWYVLEPRPGALRPQGGAYTFACSKCLLVYRDGVDYVTCVRCEREVVWFDPAFPLSLCVPCDELFNSPAESCLDCRRPMMLLAASTAPESTPSEPRPATSVGTMARYALIAFVIVQTVFALVDPYAFPYLAPFLLAAQIGGLGLVLWIAIGSRDIRNLIDHRTRLIHGLEHATIKILRQRGVPVNGGVTYRGEFVISIRNDGRTWERFPEVAIATREAIDRIVAGDHELAYSPRCGTSFLVAQCLFGVAVVAAGVGAWLLGAPLGIMWAATVGAALSVSAVARPAGFAVQRWLTVSTDLASGSVTNVDRTVTPNGDWFHVTVSLDVQPRATSGGLLSPTALG